MGVDSDMKHLTVVLMMATLALLACGGGGNQPTTNLGEIKVGAIFPTSGSNASSGTDALHGTQLAVDVLNGKYPNIDLPKLTVGKIKLVEGDSQGNPEVGASEVDRMVQTEKAVVLTGSYQSAVTLTASQRAERLQVPFVNGSSSSTALTARGLKYFFRTGPSDLTFAMTYFDWLKTQVVEHPIKKAVVLHTNDQFGNDGAKVITEQAPAFGVQLDDISFPTNSTDLTSQVQRVRSDAPDAVFVFAFLNDAVLLIKTFATLGYTPPIILGFGAGFSDPKFVTTLGAKADYSVTRAAWALEIGQKNPTAKAVADAFKAKFGQDMTENSARDFTAMMTIGAAIESSKSTDPTKIRDALVKLNLTKTVMPWKGVKFDPNGQNELAQGVIEQIVGGQYRVIFPADAATTKVVWPMPPLTGR